MAAIANWCKVYMGMDQYLLIPFLMGWTSIYQLFWGSLGTRVLTHPHESHHNILYNITKKTARLPINHHHCTRRTPPLRMSQWISAHVPHLIDLWIEVIIGALLKQESNHPGSWEIILGNIFIYIYSCVLNIRGPGKLAFWSWMGKF